MSDAPGRSIVIAGLPRSGTTWTMRALGTSPGVIRLNEPDNEDKFPAAISAKRRLGRYPCLAPGETHARYHDLWAWILDGAHEGRRSQLARRILGPGERNRIYEGGIDLTARIAGALAADPPRTGEPCRVVAKSIHAQLCIEWIAAEFPVTPLILLRHPANVLASWMEVRLKDGRNSTLESRPEVQARYAQRWGVPPPGDDPVEKMSWRIGLLIAALEEALARNPDWVVRTHEQLCTDSVATFRVLFDDLGLPWSDETERFLVENDTPGEGFVTQRVASDLADAWKRRLDDDQLATLRRVLGWFPVTTWSDADFDRGSA